MAGGTGNIRSRSPSSTNGYKTLGSILAGDSGSGSGSVRRIYGYYVRQGLGPNVIYNNIFNLNYGEYKARTQWFLKGL